MARKDHVSETPATALLKAHKVAFTEHPYEYLEHGGAQHSAEVLGLGPVRRREDAGHAGPGRQAAAGADARQPQGVHQEPGAPDRRQVGGALQARGGQPAQRLPRGRHLAVRHAAAMPVFIEESILALPKILINGGRRGYLVGIDPQVCVQVLGARAVQCALVE
jgi:hypothetical protein